MAMLALHGFEVYGLEVSHKGCDVAGDYAAAELREPSAYNFGSSPESTRSTGSIKIIQGDFFSQDWEAGTGGDRFDLIFDYTVSWPADLPLVTSDLLSLIVLMCATPRDEGIMGCSYEAVASSKRRSCMLRIPSSQTIGGTRAAMGIEWSLLGLVG